MKLRTYLQIIVMFATLALVACSVGSANMGGTPVGSTPTAPVATPVDPGSDTTTPAETPVIVSAPTQVVSSEPQSANDPTATPPETAAPATEQTEAPTEPVTMPPAIAIINETETTPAATVIDASTVVSISVPETNSVTTPSPDSAPADSSMVSEVAPSSTDSSTDSEPASASNDASQPSNSGSSDSSQDDSPAVELPDSYIALVDAAANLTQDLPAPTDSSSSPEVTVPASTTDQASNPGSVSSSDDQDDKQESEFTVSGSCLGKKKASIVYYDKRGEDKKFTMTVNCKSGKFNAKIKLLKKLMPYFEVQTLFFD